LIKDALAGVISRFDVENGHGLGPCFAKGGCSIVEDALRDLAGSRTTSFSQVIRVSTVSGAASAYLIRSQSMAEGCR
jgi:hypothetical protein